METSWALVKDMVDGYLKKLAVAKIIVLRPGKTYISFTPTSLNDFSSRQKYARIKRDETDKIQRVRRIRILLLRPCEEDINNIIKRGFSNPKGALVKAELLSEYKLAEEKDQVKANKKKINPSSDLQDIAKEFKKKQSEKSQKSALQVNEEIEIKGTEEIETEVTEAVAAVANVVVEEISKQSEEDGSGTAQKRPLENDLEATSCHKKQRIELLHQESKDSEHEETSESKLSELEGLNPYQVLDIEMEDKASNCCCSTLLHEVRNMATELKRIKDILAGGQGSKVQPSTPQELIENGQQGKWPFHNAVTPGELPPPSTPKGMIYCGDEVSAVGVTAVEKIIFLDYHIRTKISSLLDIMFPSTLHLHYLRDVKGSSRKLFPKDAQIAIMNLINAGFAKRAKSTDEFIEELTLNDLQNKLSKLLSAARASEKSGDQGSAAPSKLPKTTDKSEGQGSAGPSELPKTTDKSEGQGPAGSSD